MKKHSTRTLRKFKRFKGKHTKDQAGRGLNMLTCYDYQSARMLSETELDMILVGDSLGNVILGYDTTVSVTKEEMIIFGAAVKRGAQNKFVVVDMPFGSYSGLESGVDNAVEIFRSTKAEALKLEGAFPYQLELIERLTQIGIPVMGHIGLTPQSVHQQGGYYTHGKTETSANKLIEDAKNLQAAGVFSIVLECVEQSIAEKITDILDIPTIGIGSGDSTDGQVLVLNDLLGQGESAPGFCKPIANLRKTKIELLEKYLGS